MKRWRNRISGICGAIAALFLAAMMLLTVADVTLRAVFNRPIRGVYDLVELLLAAMFFTALPCVFLRGENIVVNSIDDMAPRWVPVLKRMAEVFAVAILAVLVWQGFLEARDSYEFQDVTADLGLPRYWHWLAVLVGLVGGALAALAMAIRRDGDTTRDTA